MKFGWLMLLGATLLGCAGRGRPPLGWQLGGAPLTVPRATWNAGWTSVELLTDGRVIVNGIDWFVVDGAGRIVDEDGQPVAMLQRDGRLLGGDDEDLGFVGVAAASAPGSKHATMAIAPNGDVLRYDDDGEVGTAGAWSGCGHYAQTLQVCMLVTHLVSARFPAAPLHRTPITPYGPFAPNPLPGNGISIGFGVTP